MMNYRFTLSTSRVFLTLVFVICAFALFLKFGPAVSSNTERPIETEIKKQSIEVESGGQITVQAAKRGNPRISLKDGRDVSTVYVGAEAVANNLQAGQARALSLVSEDFDVDGYPDLVSGYATSNGGFITFHRANKEAFAPEDPDVLEGVRRGEFPTPFRAEAETFETSAAPDFLVAGDFNRDGKLDLVTATQGGSEVYFLAGRGKASGFDTPQKLSLPGRVTALASGEIDLPNNQTDLIVAINDDNGAALLVYEGEQGFMLDQPSVYGMPAEVTSLALGQMDESAMRDLVILSGGKMLILHGRNQRVDTGQDAQARLEQVSLPFGVKEFALGEFIWDRGGRTEMALLTEDGSVQIVARGQLDTRPYTKKEVQQLRRNQAEARARGEVSASAFVVWDSSQSEIWGVQESHYVAAASAIGSGSRVKLWSAHLSGQASSDLIVLDGAEQKLKVLVTEEPAKENGEVVSFAGPRTIVTLDAESAPVTALPMRLNVMALPGIAVLREGQIIPTAIVAAPMATFNVTTATDEIDGSCGDGDCSLRDAVAQGNGSAGSDMVTFAAGLNGTPLRVTIANGGGTNEDAAAQGDHDVLQTLTIVGNGSANTLIEGGTSNATGLDKVFGFNPICISPESVSVSGVLIRFGRNTQVNGAPDFSFTGGGSDWCGFGASTLTVTTSTYNDNSVENGYGGGINLDAVTPSNGPVNISNSTISNNRTTDAAVVANGGGLNLFADQHSVTFTNCTITGNQAGTNGGSIEGGGIYIRHTNGGAIQIQNTSITNNTSSSRGGGISVNNSFGTVPVTINLLSSVVNNTSSGNNGAAEGGGIYIVNNATSSVTINEVTITDNDADDSTAPIDERGGGGIGVGTNSGPATAINISFCRVVNNTAGAATGPQFHKDNNPGSVTAENNWWGCDGTDNPTTAPCSAVVAVAPGTVDANPWLRLTHTGSPSTIVTGQTSTLTASFLLNSAGTNVGVGNLDTLIGLPITFNNAVRGNLSGAQPTIQASGTATATFTASSAGAGSADATVDTGTTTANITINKADTTATITADTPDPTVVGQSFTVNYSLAVNPPGSASPTAPTGNVTVSDGVNNCVGTVAAGSCSLTLFTPGARTLTATYAGDANFNASPASAGVAHQVNPADTTTTVGSSVNPSVFGQSVMFTATVTANAPGSGTPMGNVQFVIDSVPFGAPVALNGSGQASVSASSLSVGTHTVTANYLGNASYNASSGSLSGGQVVNQANTTTTITSDAPDPSVVGQAVTVNFTVVAVAPGAGTPTGNVTVSDGVNNCIGTVAAGTCNITLTTVGARTLTATYAGDTNFNGSVSAGAGHLVNQAATTTTITADTPDPSTVGQAVTVNFTVTVNAPGSGTPTGNVTVSDGVNNCVGTVAAGTCNVTLTTSGARTLTATYAGDTSFAGSASAGVPHQVNVIADRKALDFNGDDRADFAVITFSGALQEATKQQVIMPKMPGQRFKAGIPYPLQLEREAGGGGCAVPDFSWEVNYSNGSGTLSVAFGCLGDFPVPGQFTTDAETDIAIWRPSDQMFHILTSESNYLTEVTTPAMGDAFSDPTVFGDYTGDGIDDPAVFTGTQWIYRPNNGSGTFGAAVTVSFGQLGDFPSPGDYNDDGLNDFVVSRPDSSNPNNAHFFLDYNGMTPGVSDADGVFRESDDVIVPSDYDGDGQTEIAIADVTTFPYIHWVYFSSSTGVIIGHAWGDNTIGFQTQGDYDGDDLDDICVWHTDPTGTFFVRRSSDLLMTVQSWGLSTDYPVAYYQSH
jgi:CSLREA domain-containing protein